MKTKTKAAVISKINGKFALRAVELGNLKQGEVLVRIEASGICHTDVVAQHMLPLPAVLGHEGAGVVEKVGKGVSRVKKDDRVIISYPSCGACPCCAHGQSYICDQTFPLCFSGTRLDGSKTIKMGGKAISGAFFQQSSFATHAITTERSVIPIDSDLPAEMLAAIPCGIQTGAGAVLNTFKVSPQDGLAVFGSGAVGLSAIMAGKLSGASPLIAVDILEDRLNLALELGATHVINAGDGDTAARIREIAPRGLEFSFETSGNEQALEDAIECLAHGGQCGMVTVPNLPEKYPFTPWGVFMRGASLIGIIQGSAIPTTFLPKLIELNQQGRFPYERLIKTYKFSDINKAFQDTSSGGAIKPVLMMT